MQSVPTFAPSASFFHESAYYDAYHQYYRHFVQGCAVVTIRLCGGWCGRRGHHGEERKRSKGEQCMFRFVACFLTSSTFSFHGVVITAGHYNLIFNTTFINGTFIISTFREWDDADSYIFIDAAAATSGDQQTC